MASSPGRVPTSRIRQRRAAPSSSPKASGGSVHMLAPNVLRYRVKDAEAVAALGDVHLARRGRGDTVRGRVLCVDTPDGAGGAEVAAPGTPATVTVLLEPDPTDPAAAAALLPEYRALTAAAIRAGPELDSAQVGTLGAGKVVTALATRRLEGIGQVECAAGWVSVAAKDGKAQLELVGKTRAAPGNAPGRAPAARNHPTGWKPRPPPTETEGHRMVRRRLREEHAERDRSPSPPPPPPPVDMSGWEPRDGNAKPIIDAYLAYAPSKGRTAMGEMKVLEKQELALRTTTKRRMDRLHGQVRRILGSWEELVAEGSKQTPTDARVLVDGLEKNNNERSGKVEDLAMWYRDNMDIAIHKQLQLQQVDEDDEETEDPLVAESEAVAEGATVELVREQNRVRKLHEMMSDLAKQLTEVRNTVGELNAELRALQSTGLDALHHLTELVRGLKGAIEVADKEIRKATEHLHVQDQILRNTNEGLVQLAQTRKDREEQHEIEMERLRKLLERMNQKHLKELDTMQQLHLDRIEDMRRAVRELIEKGVQTPGLDLVALRQEAKEQVAAQGFENTKAELRKHLQDLKNQHHKLEQDFLMHSAEEQDLITQRDLALAKAPKMPAKNTEEDPLRALWRAHKSDFRDWQRQCRRAEKRPAIGTQTMEVLTEKSKVPEFLEYMDEPERPVIREPESEPQLEPELEPELESGPELKPDPEPEPEPEGEPVMKASAKVRATVRVQKSMWKPTPLAKPMAPKKFVRKVVEKEKKEKYQPPPKPKRELQVAKALGSFEYAEADPTFVAQGKGSPKNKKAARGGVSGGKKVKGQRAARQEEDDDESRQSRRPQRKILTSGKNQKAKKQRKLRPKTDPTKATSAAVAFGGIATSAEEEELEDEKEPEPDWDKAWKTIWTSIQINQTPHNFSFIEVDDAFEVEDANEDGTIGKKALGRGLRRLQIKLQSSELNVVHSAVSPTSHTLDYEAFSRELYMRVKTATGIEREEVQVEIKQRPYKHPPVKEKEQLPWQQRVWKTLRAALLSHRNISSHRLSDIHAGFHAIDTGKDGQLDIHEVGRAFHQLDIPLTQPQLNILFDAADVDKAGYIAYPELVEEIYSHIQEIVEQDPVTQEKLRKKKEKKEAVERHRKAAAKKIAEEQNALLAELTEQTKKERKNVRRLERFLKQTEEEIHVLDSFSGVEERGGADAVLGRTGPNQHQTEHAKQLESFRAARKEAEHMLAEMVKTQERTAERCVAIQAKAKEAKAVLGLDSTAADVPLQVAVGVDGAGEAVADLDGAGEAVADLDGAGEATADLDEAGEAVADPAEQGQVVAGEFSDEKQDDEKATTAVEKAEKKKRKAEKKKRKAEKKRKKAEKTKRKKEEQSKKQAASKGQQGSSEPEKAASEVTRQQDITSATAALFDSVELDSSGKATAKALLEMLESGRKGEWDPFAEVMSNKLSSVIPETKPLDVHMKTVIGQAASRKRRSRVVQSPDSDSDSDDDSPLPEPVKMDHQEFLQLLASHVQADESAAQVDNRTSGGAQVGGIPEQHLLTSPSDGAILDASSTNGSSSSLPSPLQRFTSWPGAADLPSERILPPDYGSPTPEGSSEDSDEEEEGQSSVRKGGSRIARNLGLEVDGAAAESGGTTTDTTTPPRKKPRTFKLTVSIDPTVEEETEIEVEASDIDGLHREVKKAMGLDERLDIRLSAEAQPTLPHGASPRAVSNLAQLPSPAKIQVWMRDPLPTEDSISETGEEEEDDDEDEDVDDHDESEQTTVPEQDDGVAKPGAGAGSSNMKDPFQRPEGTAQIDVSQSLPALGVGVDSSLDAGGDNEQDDDDDDSDEDDSDSDSSDDETDSDSDTDEEEGMDLSELRSAFSAVEAASSRQSVQLEAAERKTQAAIQETLSTLAAEEASSDVEPPPPATNENQAAQFGSAVFTDPSAPQQLTGAEALENALRPVTAPQHMAALRKPSLLQASSGSVSWRDVVPLSPRALSARQQDEQLTAVAEALRTPPTTIQGLTLSASSFPTSWSGREATAARDGGYVPIRPWGPSTPRNQTPTRLASLAGETSGPPVVVHSATHNGYVLGQAKLGKPGRSLRLRPATSSALPSGGQQGLLANSRSTLPPVWSSGSLATIVPSLPAEPVSHEVMPHAVFLSASGPITPRVALRSIGSRGSSRGKLQQHYSYANMPNSAPVRGSRANFKFAPRTPLGNVRV